MYIFVPSPTKMCASKSPSIRASGQGDVITCIAASRRAELLSKCFVLFLEIIEIYLRVSVTDIERRCC